MELKANKEPIRHGDINFAPVDKVLENPQIVKKLVVAEGETPGHFHAFTAGEGGSIAVLEGTEYFEILNAPAILDHPEHGKVKVLPGVYKHWKERERDPFTSAIREVRD